MAEIVRAVVLGAVQALTEFLPVSSSGHLLLASRTLGGSVDSLTFDVGLHLGTAVAVLGYFWRDWIAIVRAVLAGAREHGIRPARWEGQAQLGLWILLGTAPAAIAGLILSDRIERDLREPAVVGVALILGGILIGAADRWGGTLRRLPDMRGGAALLVGLAQASALVPGVSRSGITIATARGLGFERYAATRFSFLLSMPIVVAAGLYRLASALAGDEQLEWGLLALGACAALLVGAAVIRFLLGFVQGHSLLPFVLYRLALGALVLALVARGDL